VFELGIFVIKLLLAILAFVLIGWFGAREKRVGGALLTFPLLNGIAMLTGVDPLDIANTIYLVVMWNGILFLIAMYQCERLPPLPAGLAQEAKIVGRALFWVTLWAAGAVFLAWFRDDLPSVSQLFAIQLALAALYVVMKWRAPLPAASPSFSGMWNNWQGYMRIVGFLAAFLILSAIAYFGESARWVGWASALPLPGIFALAILSATQSKDDLLSLGDTVLLGPLLVIPFNWLLARAIVHLRLEDAGTAAEVATVIVCWLIAAGAIFFLLPPLARWRDTNSRVR
jgi:hypothetical protein